MRCINRESKSFTGIFSEVTEKESFVEAVGASYFACENKDIHNGTTKWGTCVCVCMRFFCFFFFTCSTMMTMANSEIINTHAEIAMAVIAVVVGVM